MLVQVASTICDDVNTPTAHHEQSSSPKVSGAHPKEDDALLFEAGGGETDRTTRNPLDETVDDMAPDEALRQQLDEMQHARQSQAVGVRARDQAGRAAELTMRWFSWPTRAVGGLAVSSGETTKIPGNSATQCSTPAVNEDEDIFFTPESTPVKQGGGRIARGSPSGSSPRIDADDVSNPAK